MQVTSLDAPVHAGQSTSSDPMLRPRFVTQQSHLCCRFRFHGHAGEYFGIWLTNIILTILTLSFYTPWAKARRLRYFYGNTELLNRRFDFTGLPSKILLGRLLALELYALTTLLSNYSIQATSIAFGLLYLSIPWLLRLTLMFKARNSKFGNTRFYFSGTNKGAYRVFVLAIVINICTLFLFFPVFIWLYRCYYYNHLQVGQLKFQLNTHWRPFMRAMYMPLFLFLACMIIGIITMQLMDLTGLAEDILKISLWVFYGGLLILLWPLMRARLFIITWNNIRVGDHYFKTEANQWIYAWILLSNFVLKVFSLGLMSPWAAIRLYQYQLGSMTLYLSQDADDLRNALQKDPNAFADEVSSFFDFDASL